jgi:hypothetical protein
MAAAVIIMTADLIKKTGIVHLHSPAMPLLIDASRILCNAKNSPSTRPVKNRRQPLWPLFGRRWILSRDPFRIP